MNKENPLNTSLKLDFYDLYENEGLKKIDAEFKKFFALKNLEIYQKFCDLKLSQSLFSKSEKDLILIESAKILEDFLVFLFDIEKENLQLQKLYQNLSKIPLIRRDFVQRIIAKKYSGFLENQDYEQIDGFKILRDLKSELKEISEFFEEEFSEKNYKNLSKIFVNEEKISKIEAILAQKIFSLLEKDLDEKEQEIYEKLSLYAIWALYFKDGKRFHQNGSLFKLPQKIDYENLAKIDDFYEFKARDKFNLSDSGFNLNQALSEVNYCIFCHKQEKDSCRTGLLEKNQENNEVKFKKNPLEITLEGCPLEQKISEMNLLKSEFFSIGSLAVAMIDNPLLAATGHRICNDCMKSCIFQKQDPVNIPQIESRILKDVLTLPYGFEIYSLLTRWNPLKDDDELPKNKTNKNILIAGLGPAGFTLAHYLLNEGHNVVAIDGLKIEPLNKEISGVDEYKNSCDFKPIKFIDEIYQPLQERLIQGFGGVVEYGITSRFDKNFLTIIRLILERRRNFMMFGGLRFGSSIKDKMAFDEYGFDHIALCIGAGKPNIINIENNFCKGIKSASDFLMALQLTGAFKENLFTNLQIRLPILVVGAGLTAVDTAIEAQEYYILQIEKFHKNFKILQEKLGNENFFNNFNDEEKNVIQEFIKHFEELQEIGKEKFLEKYHSKILYRKEIQNSPSYRLNHEELKKAFEQKIEFVKNQNPIQAITDEFNHIKALKCENGDVFDCKTLLIAAGTSPNISVKIEDKINLNLDGKYFAQIDENGNKITANFLAKSFKKSFFTRIDDDKKAISFFGDLHPNFEGNVVKAMTSAKNGFKDITKILQKTQNTELKFSFFDKIRQDFLTKIEKINKISNYLNEIYIKAPLLAKNSEIGQIFRLQNFHSLAKTKENQILAMEGISVTALEIDKENGVIKAIILDFGGSTGFIKNFYANEPCVFMGPSGKPTEISENENVLLIGGGRGNMPLCAVANEFRKKNCKVIFVASYRKNEYVQRLEDIEKSSNIAVFAIEEEKPNLKLEAHNFQFQGNVIKALQEFFKENPMKIHRIFTIGNDKMMAEIAKIRGENLIKEISEANVAIASLNASMQCMMKGVCSQCLQKKYNENGEIEYFYACANQDQNMDLLDFRHLSARCDQNSMQEKFTRIRISELFS